MGTLFINRIDGIHYNLRKFLVRYIVVLAFIILFWCDVAAKTSYSLLGRMGFEDCIVSVLHLRAEAFIFMASGIVCTLLAAFNLRKLFRFLCGDTLAACATSDGLTFSGRWRRKFYAWCEVEEVCLHITRIGRRDRAFLRVKRRTGQHLMIATDAVDGGRVAVENWVMAVQSFKHR